MKFMQFQVTVAACIAFYTCINAEAQKGIDRTFVPSQAKRNMAVRHGPQTSRNMSEQDVTTVLNKLKREPYSIQKLAALRHLMMRSRHTVVSEQTQEKFDALLQEAHKNHNKEDRREFLILRGTLNMAQMCTLLSANQKENVKKLLADLPEDKLASNNEKSSSDIADLFKIKAKDQYQEKACSLLQMMRKKRLFGSNKNIQNEISAAIHDLYSQRPLNNISMLAKLQSVLQQAQTSPLVSTVKQYEVKEIMLPEVNKNLAQAQSSANTKVTNSANKTITV